MSRVRFPIAPAKCAACRRRAFPSISEAPVHRKRHNIAELVSKCQRWHLQPWASSSVGLVVQVDIRILPAPLRVR